MHPRCKRTKCICLPVCKTKQVIVCDDLFSQYKRYQSEVGKTYAWKILSEYYPSLEFVTSNKADAKTYRLIREATE